MMIDRQVRAFGVAGADDDRDARPRAPDGRELISTRGLLEWAFGVEFASLDYDEINAVSGGGGGTGAEYRIMQQLALGTKPGVGVKVDTSIGRSLPADDADLVASVLRNCVRWQTAVWVAELARAGRIPRWDLGQPRLQPKSWGKRNHIGQLGRAEVVREVSYICRGRRRVRKDL